jgi:thiol-disulfide isomerase/thioredoxin
MKRRIFLAWLIGGALACAGVLAADPGPSVEQRVAAAVQSKDVTVVHFWAPWCPNCKAELAGGGWSSFIAANPKVHVVFVTIWHGEDGRELLLRNGVGGQPNFELLLHPNPSRERGQKVEQMLGIPISWIPSTWVFRDGKLRYAMNYGELRFPMLQQLVRDSSDAWEH